MNKTQRVQSFHEAKLILSGVRKLIRSDSQGAKY